MCRWRGLIRQQPGMLFVCEHEAREQADTEITAADRPKPFLQFIAALILPPSASCSMNWCRLLTCLTQPAVSVPCSPGQSDRLTQPVLQGQQAVELLLHRPGCTPQQLLCPAELLMRSAGKQQAANGAMSHSEQSSRQCPQADMLQTADGTMDALLWVHPGAWHEAKAVLAAASTQHGATFASRCAAPSKQAVANASALQASVRRQLCAHVSLACTR